MNWLDIIIAIVILGSVIGGLSVGTLRTFFGIIGLVLGTFLAGRYHDILASPITWLIGHPNFSHLIGFGIIFCIGGAIVGIPTEWFARLRRRKSIIFGCPDRIVGGLLGFVQGGAIAEVALVLLAKYPISWLEPAVLGSAIGHFLLIRWPFMMQFLPKGFQAVAELFM
ncbi:MAG: CvpA family protein [Anaerolineae bacterium]